MRQYGQPFRGRGGFPCLCCNWKDGANRKPSRGREKRQWQRDVADGPPPMSPPTTSNEGRG